MRMENILWIENIVESTSTLPFLTNSGVDMAGFVHPHKAIARRNAFSTLLNALTPFTGIMVKTPKPIQVAILGPKNYRFGLMDLDLIFGDDICKYLEYL